MSGEIEFSSFSELDESEDKEFKEQKEMVEDLGKSALVLTQPKEKEEERQFNIGKLPISVHKQIDEAALARNENRRTFILKALVAQGLDIPKDLLRDRRKARY